MTHASGGAINRVSRTTEVDIYTIHLDRIMMCDVYSFYLFSLQSCLSDLKGSVNSME